MATLKKKVSHPVKVNKIQKPAVSTSREKFFYAVGRRKTAVARVRLWTGKGELVVNDQPASKYFAAVDPEGTYITKPFSLTHVNNLTGSVKVEGAGPQAQLDAVVHGIARALVKTNEEFKPTLKESGYITRDARMKESRKIGRGGKARRNKQSPKR